MYAAHASFCSRTSKNRKGSALHRSQTSSKSEAPSLQNEPTKAARKEMLLGMFPVAPKENRMSRKLALRASILRCAGGLLTC